MSEEEVERGRRDVRTERIDEGTIGVTRGIGMAHCEYSMLSVVANNELHALSPDLAAPAQATRQSSTDLFQEVIQRGVDRGDFNPPHVWLAVAAIGGMGIRVANWYSSDFELNIDEVADAYAEFALRITRSN